MGRSWLWILGLATAALIWAGLLADFSDDDPGFAEAPGAFAGRFLAAADADMAGTAYADGRLEPFAGAEDQLILFEDGAPVATVPAANSVVSWPQILAASPDGRRAYVVESRGGPPQNVDRLDSVYSDLPDGSALQAFAIEERRMVEIARIENVGLNPQSVEVSPGGDFLVVASERPGQELVLVPLDAQGLPGAPQSVDLAPPYRPEDAEPRIRNLHLAPDGRTLAVNVANRRVQFYELTFDSREIPNGVRPLGPPVDVGVRLAVGRWTQDSRFFLITDVNAYDSTFAMLTQRGGQVHALAAPDGEAPARVVNSVRVGRFAEGLEISDDGRYVASIAMARTYLPEWWFLEVWPRRRTYSLFLIGLDPASGRLTALDEIRAAGVLPEDVIFDETGRNLAVAVFHRRKGADRLRGFIDYFSIGEDDQLTAQGRTQAVMRGPHDLVRLAE